MQVPWIGGMPRRLLARSGGILRHGSTHLMLVGSLMAGLGAYGYQVIGARVLGDVDYAPIGVLWTIQYLTLSVVLYTLEAYVTRLTALDADRAVGLRRVIRQLAAAIVALAAVLAAVSFVFREQLFSGLDDLALVVGLTVLTYGCFVIVRGLFAGADRFGAYGVATALESVARLLLAVPVLLIFGTARSLAWITPLGALVAAGWWWAGGRLRPPARRPRWHEPGSSTLTPFRFVGLTSIANAAAQLILAGGPLALVALGATPSEISVFFISITAARAPLVIAYGGLLSRAMPYLTRLAMSVDGHRLLRVSMSIVLVSGVVAALAGALGGLAGPWLIALFFGDSFTPAWWLAAGIATGVVLATGALVLNQVLIALGSEQRMVAPWLASAAAAAVVLMALRDDALLSVTVAFVIAEVVAVVGLSLAIRNPANRGSEVGAEGGPPQTPDA